MTNIQSQIYASTGMSIGTVETVYLDGWENVDSVKNYSSRDGETKPYSKLYDILKSEYSDKFN